MNGQTAVTHIFGIPKIFALEWHPHGVFMWVPGLCEIRALCRRPVVQSWKLWIKWYADQVGPHIAALYLAPVLGIKRPGTFDELLVACHAMGRTAELSRAVELARAETADRVFRKFMTFYKFVHKKNLLKESDDEADRDCIAFGLELSDHKQRIRERNEKRAKRS